MAYRGDYLQFTRSAARHFYFHAVAAKSVTIVERSRMRYLGILLCLSASAFAGEYAVLANGARLHADRHETEDGKVRLYTSGGYIELSAAEVRTFEADGAAPASTSAPAAAVPPTVSAPKPVATPAELADAAADKYGLPRQLVRSVMRAESAGNPKAVSPKGAIGLMQLMPGTAKELGANPADPAQNVDAGVRYLRDLLEKYNHGLYTALAAYNAGEGAVQKYHGIPPYAETIGYIYRIARNAGY
jgi:soluble lytic murein transglycosylase-like protein